MLTATLVGLVAVAAKVRASGKHQEVREARDQWSHDKPAFLAASPTTPADDPLAEAKKAVQNLNVDLGRNIKRLSDKLQAPDSKVPVEDVMDFLKIINTKFSVNTSSVRAKLSRARPKAGLTGDDVASMEASLGDGSSKEAFVTHHIINKSNGQLADVVKSMQKQQVQTEEMLHRLNTEKVVLTNETSELRARLEELQKSVTDAQTGLKTREGIKNN
ncbi:MAG: hypothetical protein EOO40_04085, partial [Deltaproteobacteria bacterium]